MPRIRRKLPPLTGLTVFEATARLGSFTKASSELGVTQAAVSRQIHILEETFGFPLFRRLHRRVELTDKGLLLANAATAAFNLLVEAVEDITREGEDDEIVISATVSFSHFWLLPRIFAFSRQYPEIKLRIISQDKVDNIENSGIDLAIRYGNGIWPDGHADFLFDDEIFPVCSPDYAEKLGEISDLTELIRHPLITHDTDDPNWAGWNEWLAAFSVQGPRRASGMRCSFYTEAIYAALDGQGIVLGWRRLVEDLLNQGRLVRVTPHSLATRNGYFIVVPKSAAGNPLVRQFSEWLKQASLDRS